MLRETYTTPYGDEFNGLYGRKISEVKNAGQTVLVAGHGAQVCWLDPSKYDPIEDWNTRFMWHGKGIYPTGEIDKNGDEVMKFKANIGFVDGHADNIELIVGRADAPTYKWNAQ